MIFISTLVRPLLQSSDDKIKSKFKTLTDFEDVALLLEIPVEFLWKILIRDKQINYKSFPLAKKNGGYRTIYSPSKNLTLLQKKLAYILSLNFTPHTRAYGFIEKRSIVTNASEHLKKNYVLNIDLENFFESISFARVRKMFISYFKFNDTVSTTLANICVHPDGILPQGAATSPIISNILAKSLDKELLRLSLESKGVKYTRYADDITFSTNKKTFPKAIALLNDDKQVILSDNLIQIIKSNGFNVNERKIRLQDREGNQSVTGITVNEKLNVSRTYIRRIRSILNCIEKNINDLDFARSIFERKYPFRQRVKGNYPDMFLVLRGMITHVGHVKGKRDPIYLKLASRFNRISPKKMIINSAEKQNNKRKAYEDYTYVIDQDDIKCVFDPKMDDMVDLYYGQGTGVLLKGIGVVTNTHVLGTIIDALDNGAKLPSSYRIRVFKHDSELACTITCYDPERDIAILTPDDIDCSAIGLEYNTSITKGQSIDLIGYPNYRQGQEIRVENGFVQGKRIHKGTKGEYIRHEISPTIYAGNSGGPVVNENAEVIAIAAKGATENGVVPNEVIPISEIIKLAQDNGLLNERMSSVQL
ncbi:reverse transcriptase domain-containing protein [Paenibacillus tarimensis]|uniref:reverse transcriptase domain-containing protein n=1 Tax=Paenibacillus tarimensis TaxID=416012 RepID=UPI001EFF3B22|nr:reverse transcriptase domain-containing protein [Paenibacillus tarimensis]MCF2945654.1 trypsin-like peptidase domain-containing protein [Paenibacillus tarimensis]